MKQKRWTGVLTMLLVLALFLGGCGNSLESKVAAVQKANTITVEDVVSLLELEGLTLEKQQPNEAFAAQWPDTVAYRVNGENLLLLQSFAEDLQTREKRLQEIGWYGNERFSRPEDVAVLQQAIAQFQPAEESYLWPILYQGKNIVAWYVMFVETDGSTQEEMDAVSQTNDVVRRVFQSDINNMQTETFTETTEHFTVQLTIESYQTPLTVEERTLYDTYLSAVVAVQMDDGLLAQYEGQPFSATAEALSGTFSASKKGDALWSKGFSLSVEREHEIDWSLREQPARYLVTVTVGDLTETVEIGQADGENAAE